MPEEAPSPELAAFLLTLETRWLATSLLLRALIEQTAALTDERLTAAVFDAVSASIDKTLDASGDPSIARSAHAIIDGLAADIAKDRQAAPAGAGAKRARRPRGRDPKPR